MIFWYENLDLKPEEVNQDSLRKILKRRHKISISPSCAKFYEGKHLCVCPFDENSRRVLMGNEFAELRELYLEAVADI